MLLKQSTQIDPNFALANGSLGDIYLQKKDYQKAKGYYEKVVLLQPYNPAPRLQLIRLYQKQGNFNGAHLHRQKIAEMRRQAVAQRIKQQKGIRMLQERRKALLHKRPLETREEVPPYPQKRASS